jgi:putative transposase
MLKKREFIDGSFYHVTSRTNDKIRVFENNVGRKIMLITLQDAKDKFHFRLTNFCVMPTHIHLLIKPPPAANLSVIMQWIKLTSAKRWNGIHGSIDHLWGNRYFARAVKSPQEYEYIMNYIDQNPVVAGLSTSPGEWKASGAFYKKREIPDLVDLSFEGNKSEIKLLPSIPFAVSRLFPQAQLEWVLHYIGAYAVTLDRLYDLIPKIPKIGGTKERQKPSTYLHYYTGTHDYFISEYDGEDTMYGTVKGNVYPAKTRWQKFNLSNLKKNPLLRLEFGN